MVRPIVCLIGSFSLILLPYNTTMLNMLRLSWYINVDLVPAMIVLLFVNLVAKNGHYTAHRAVVRSVSSY